MVGMRPAGPAGDRLAAVALCVALFGALAAMVVAAVFRGLWIDEVWTLWMSQRDLPLAQVFRHRWTQDVHPFTFFALNWLMRPILGESLVVRRLLNLIPLALFVATSVVLARRNRRFAKVAWVYVPLVMANFWAIAYFAEYRSYFTVFCCTAALVAVLYCVIEAAGDVTPRDDPALATLAFVWALAALVVHYVATLLVGPFLIVVVLDLARRRRFGWAVLLAAAGFLALVYMAACLFEQRAYLAANGARFWIRTSPIKCIRYFIWVGSSVVIDNPVAAVAAVAGVAQTGMMAAGLGARMAWLGAPDAFSRRFLVLVGLAMGAGMAVVLAVDTIRPVAAARYLIPLEPIVASLTAVAAADILLSRRGITLLFAANVLATAAILTPGQIHDRRWNFFIDRIRREIGACPSARVYGLDESFVSNFPYPANEPEVEAWGYQYVARTHGLTIRYLRPNQPDPVAIAPTCPTLIWGAHIDETRGPRELRQAPFNRHAPAGFSWSRARLVTDAHENPLEIGFLYILPPPGPAASPSTFNSKGASAIR
jgi:hypothetical protein